MATFHAVAARAIVTLAFIAAGAGLCAVLDTESRLWGPEAAHISQGGRFILIPLLVPSHGVGLVAALPARRFLRHSLFVLAAASGCAWSSISLWADTELNRTQLVVGLMSGWIIQMLASSFSFAGGSEAWNEYRTSQKNPEPGAALDPARDTGSGSS